MDGAWELLLNALTQFAGGPGPPENNLVRFGLAAVFWSLLLAFAWLRQRKVSRPREKWLVIGFGLSLFRELFMLSHVLVRMMRGSDHDALCAVVVPIEHTLTLVSIVAISGAFLRFLSENQIRSERFLRTGIVLTALVSLATFASWPLALMANPAVRFHETWSAWFIHLVAALLIGLAQLQLIREKGWLRNAVLLALSLFLLSELLVLANFLTGQAQKQILCPFGNLAYLLAMPVLGYVYFREQAIEKQRAERQLDQYRAHLEEVVTQRTAELTESNALLEREIKERTEAESAIASRNRELAAQNAIADTISRALDQTALLSVALDQTLALFGMDSGCVALSEDGRVRRVAQTEPSPAGCSGLDASRHETCGECPFVARLMRRPAALAIRATHSSCDCAGLFPGVGDLRVLFGTALVATDGPLGAMILGAGVDRDLEANEWRLLRAIGQQLGVAIDRFRLLKRLERAAALEERQRIAAEMHDGLAQTLSSVTLKTSRAAELIDGGHPQEVALELANIQEAVEQAAKEVRQSIASLRDKPGRQGSLQATLEHVASEARSADGPAVTLVDDLPGPLLLSAADQFQIERIVAEAVANACRHGRAQNITLQLRRNEHQLYVSVDDDGSGFNVNGSRLDREGHFGLSIMEARAARLNGSIAWTSQPGEGTRVLLTCPASGVETPSEAAIPARAGQGRAETP